MMTFHFCVTVTIAVPWAAHSLQKFSNISTLVDSNVSKDLGILSTGRPVIVSSIEKFQVVVSKFLSL
jgi:hypothetical protein